MALDRKAFVKHLSADIEWAEAYYAETVEPQLIERYEIYRASKERYRRLFPHLTERNRVELRSFDLWSTVEWMLPGLLRAFFGSDTILAVNGRGGEDAARAATFEKLLSWQNTVKNPGYRIFKDWFRDALSMNLGVLKCWWRRDEKRTVRDEVLSVEQLRMLERDGANRILSVTPGPFETYESLRVKWENRLVLENCPEFETVRPSDIRFVPDARHLADTSMVAHRKPVSIDHLRKEARKGLYDGAVVEEIAKTGEGWVPTALEKALDKASETTATKLSEDKTPRRRVTIHECYCKYDLDGDGELEDAIATVCGDKLLRVVENPYGRHCFFDLVPFTDGYQIWSDLGLPEVVGDVQDANTAFFRQMVVALAQSNEGRGIVNEQSVQLQDLVDNLQYVRATGPSTDWYRPLESPGMDANTFRLYELFRGSLEQWTPQTRYNQGTDGSSLNKMLALDTPIPLIDGTYKLNKDIVAGDVVVGSDGKGTVVTKAHPVQIPKRAFKLRFKSGDVIRAGGEHWWMVKVNDKHDHTKQEWRKMLTEEMYDLVQKGDKLFIPRVGPVDFTEKDLPLDPYVFGVWLGDGQSHTNRFTSADPEIVQRVEAWAKGFYGGRLDVCRTTNSGEATTYSIVNTPFRLMLKDLGCLKDSRYEQTRDNVKHIPEIYLQGSFEQRLSLLRGLMDTDGCIDKNGNAIFCNSEPALVEGVALLIESLGGKPNVAWRTVQMNWTNTPDKRVVSSERKHAHITFAIPYCPVSIKRKVERWKTDAKYWESQRVKSIEEIPVEPMRCLSVAAADEQYCCGQRLTLTMNTATGINLIMTASQARQDEVIRNFAETGIADFMRFEIMLNQRYMDQATHFRLANEFLEVTPDDLQGDFDLSINATTGVADRAAQNQALREYLERLYPYANQLGLATPAHFARAARRVLELNGIENASEYILTPEEEGYVGPVGTDSGGAGGGVPVGAAGVPGGGGGVGAVAAAGGGYAGGGVGAVP